MLPNAYQAMIHNGVPVRYDYQPRKDGTQTTSSLCFRTSRRSHCQTQTIRFYFCSISRSQGDKYSKALYSRPNLGPLAMAIELVLRKYLQHRRIHFNNSQDHDKQCVSRPSPLKRSSPYNAFAGRLLPRKFPSAHEVEYHLLYTV